MISFILIFSIFFLFIISLLLASKLFLLRFLNEICCEIREFIKINESFFNISFLALFAVEQILLLYIAYKLNMKDLLLQFVIGIFVIIVLSTASLEKIILDIKNRELKKIIFNQDLENTKILDEYKALKEIDKIRLENKK